MNRGLAAIALGAGALVSGCAAPQQSPPTVVPVASAPATPGQSSPGSESPAAGLPEFAHVYVILLENKDFGSLVGSADAPYFNSLVAGSGLATAYTGVAHPSQPNYLALFSGSTQNVTDDGVHDISAQNLADQLEGAGKTWAVYAQDYPGNCFAGATASGSGEGGGKSGSYARKHNPAISFTEIAGNPARCARIRNLSSFDPAAADFSLVVPNECNDMHSCSVADGDAFLRTFVPKIMSSPAFANSVLFITTDEGTDNAGGGGRVATLVVSPLAKAGLASSVPHDHYGLLRTIEDAWGLGCLGNACRAAPLTEFFT